MQLNINKFILKNKNKILIFAFVICLFYSLFFAFNTQAQWGQDSFWYMTLGKNLATGNGYTLDKINPHSQYPPGFPILLIPLFLLLNNIHLSGLIITIVFSILTLFLTYIIAKEESTLIAIFSVLLLCFNYLFVSFTTSVLTEIPFAFFSLLGLYLFIKGFEKPKYFLYAFPLIAFSCLIRYDGFFLIFPMLFYSYTQKKKIKKLILNDSTLIGIGIGGLILSFWFLRNYFAFGNPFFTSYLGYSFKLGFSSIYTFFIRFFYIGFLTPIFSLIGIYYIIKKKNLFFSTFVIWFFSYLILHSIWGFKLTRFYVEILPIIIIFTLFGIVYLTNKLTKNHKTFNQIFLIFILIILISQIFIFFNPIGNWGGENIIPKLNKYQPIKEVCEFANLNLPNKGIYIVPDIPAYSFFLNKSNIFDYQEGFTQLFSGKYRKNYLLVDTIHMWVTKNFLSARKGNFTILVPTADNQIIKVNFKTKLLNQANNNPFLGQIHKNQSCFIVELENMSISKYH